MMPIIEKESMINTKNNIVGATFFRNPSSLFLKLSEVKNKLKIPDKIEVKNNALNIMIIIPLGWSGAIV